MIFLKRFKIYTASSRRKLFINQHCIGMSTNKIRPNDSIYLNSYHVCIRINRYSYYPTYNYQIDFYDDKISNIYYIDIINDRFGVSRTENCHTPYSYSTYKSLPINYKFIMDAINCIYKILKRQF
jgi:hypothetical protein